MYKLILSDKLYIPRKLYNKFDATLKKWLKSKTLKIMFDPTTCVTYSRSLPCKILKEKGRKGCYSCKEAKFVIKTYSRTSKWFIVERGDIEFIDEVIERIEAEHNIVVKDKRVYPKLKIDMQYSVLWKKLEEPRKSDQIKTCKDWLKYKKGIVVAPAGSGKTGIGVILASKLKTRVVIIIHQKELLDQFYNSFMKFTDIESKSKLLGHKLIAINPRPDEVDKLSVCLYTWQQFISKTGKQRLRDIKNKFGLLLVDECLPGNTLVLIDYNYAVPIAEIHSNESITYVLSYDLDKKKIVKRKIIKKIKNNVIGGMVKFYVNGKSLTVTETHKIYTKNKGYIPAKELKIGDTVVTYDGDISRGYVCEECGDIFDNTGSKGRHKLDEHAEMKKCPFCKTYISAGAYPQHVFWCKDNIDNFKNQNKTKNNQSIKRLSYTETNKGKIHAQNTSKRMTINNPMLKEETRIKSGIGVSKAFWAKSKKERDKQVKIFMDAPIHINKPNNKEKEVIDCSISNLQFTGDGIYFITLNPAGLKRDCDNCKDIPCYSVDRNYKKNPDFIYIPFKCGTCKYLEECKKEEGVRVNTNACVDWVRSPSYRTNKVIEVMDFEYWHCKDKAKLLKKMYKRVGVDCLILDAKLNINDKQAKIESFINNHDETITKIVYIPSSNLGTGGRPKVVFNLTVYGTHNYFAVGTKNNNINNGYKPILVSNCHKLGANKFSKRVSRFNSKYRCGLTATPERKDQLHFKSNAIMGPPTIMGGEEQLSCDYCFVETGWVTPNYKNWTPRYWNYFWAAIANNEERNDLIVETAKEDLKNGYKIIIPVKRVAHANYLADEIRKVTNSKVISYISSVKNRTTVSQDIRDGKYDVVTATKGMISLGFDAPSMSCIYITYPSFDIHAMYQEFSRIRRPLKGKNKPLIRFFIDDGPISESFRKKAMAEMTKYKFEEI